MNLTLMINHHVGELALFIALANKHKVTAVIGYSKGMKTICEKLRIPYYEGFMQYQKVIPIFHRGLGDLLLSVHGKDIIPDFMLERYTEGGINFHPFIKDYKGTEPTRRAFEAGETTGTISAHKMTKVVDCGEILHHKEIDISQAKSVSEIYGIMYPLYIDILMEVLK